MSVLPLRAILLSIVVINTSFVLQSNELLKKRLVALLAQEFRMETDRLILRRLSLADRDDIFEYSSDKEVNKHLVAKPYKSKEDAEKFIKSAIQKYQDGLLSLAMEHKQEKRVVGTIYLPIEYGEKRGELGFILNKKYWGKGLTLEASRRLLEFGFNDLQLNRIQAMCSSENKSCQNVLQKLHMLYEGTLRQYRRDFKFPDIYIDAQVWALLRSDFLSQKSS